MFKAGSSFRFPAKALQMRFGRPRAQADHFKRDCAIETFLMGAINYALTAAANFLQQLVIAKVCEHSCWWSGFLPIQCLHTTIAIDISGRGYRFVVEKTKTTL